MGLFKKVVIADSCAVYVDMIFSNSSEYSGSTLLIGAVCFSFQIYGDFSGYSDIAIGTARLFGINLMRNFAYPYFSRDIAEFWRRWHISLSTWFRDYLYIPLGGSHGSNWMKIRNTFIIFLVSGFWHGANWTFISWGALNALFFLPLLLKKKNRKHINIVAKGKSLPSIREFLQILITFMLTTLAWVFFRAESVQHAFYYLSRIFSISIFSVPDIGGVYKFLIISLLIVVFVVVEWIGRENQFAIQKVGEKWKPYMRYVMYYVITIVILLFAGEQQEFIYFQF